MCTQTHIDCFGVEKVTYASSESKVNLEIVPVGTIPGLDQMLMIWKNRYIISIYISWLVPIVLVLLDFGVDGVVCQIREILLLLY